MHPIRDVLILVCLLFPSHYEREAQIKRSDAFRTKHGSCHPDRTAIIITGR